MKRKLPVLIVILCGVVPLALAADEPKAAAESNTVIATRSVQIGGVSEFYASQLVLKAAAERADVAGLDPDRVGERVRIRRSAGGQLSTRRIPPSAPEVLEIVVDLTAREGLPAAKPLAVEYLDAIIKSLEDKLRDVHSGLTQAAERGLREVDQRLRDADQKASAIEEEIRDVTGRFDASIDSIRAAIPKLEEERQSLRLQMVGRQARQDALAKAIQRMASKAEESLKDDEVAGQFEKIAATRAEQLKLVETLHKAGDASQAAVAEAESAVAEANARVLERREAVKNSAGGGEVLGALNRELAMLSIDVAEAEARLDATERLLKKYAQAQPMLSEAERVRRERERLEKSRDRAEESLRDAQANVPSPVLQVVASEAIVAGDPRLKGDVFGERPPGSPPEQ